jgi:hypothetical protein
VAAFIFQLVQSFLNLESDEVIIIYTISIGFFAIISHLAAYYFPYSSIDEDIQNEIKRETILY